MRRKHDECDTPQWCGCDCHTAATDTPADNTVNSHDDEIEHVARTFADDVSLELDARDIEHQVDVQWNGDDGDDDGWYVVIAAGRETGIPLREYTLTYDTRDRRWLVQVDLGEEEQPEQPRQLDALTAGSSPVEVAEHIAANVGGAS
jgi:hypothetical protein